MNEAERQEVLETTYKVKLVNEDTGSILGAVCVGERALLDPGGGDRLQETLRQLVDRYKQGEEGEVREQHVYYFGVCPECGLGNGYLNVHKTHFFVCDTHKVFWCVGFNLFSSWQEEDEQIWKENSKKLDSYKYVEELNFCSGSPCRGECVSEWEKHFKKKYPSGEGHTTLVAMASDENLDDIPF
jgi:hypothetical protein